MKIFTYESLKQALTGVRQQGWVTNGRQGNDGGVGNTLEDQLGIAENNLPLPNAAEWELKAQRSSTTSMTTLFHMEPSPRALHVVPAVLLPRYGWTHAEAGRRYSEQELSFRQTINGRTATDRGFSLQIDRAQRKLLVSFDPALVAPNHAEWLERITRACHGDVSLTPQPYWGFDDLFHEAGRKLINCFYLIADVRRQGQTEQYRYSRGYVLHTFSLDRFLEAIETGEVLVDFDARSGHNHGTKFRCKQGTIKNLYARVEPLWSDQQG